MEKTMISVIVKTYNEEKYIGACLASLTKALRGHKHEILVVDSLSDDRTLDIARKHNVRILQITDPSRRRASVGPELGFRNSKGEYILLIDGDMELQVGFVEAALKELKDTKVAGVQGTIDNIPADTLIHRRYSREKKKLSEGEVPYLDGGGMYKREAIDKVGYFSNPWLFSYEEADLGYRITSHGYHLLRLSVPHAVHNAYSGSSVKILINRYRSGYLKGAGQVLRYNRGLPGFRSFLLRFRLYFLTIFWWLALAVGLFLGINYTFRVFLSGWLVVVIVLLFKGRAFSDALFSVISWHLTSVAMIAGLLLPKRDITQKIPFKEIR